MTTPIVTETRRNGNQITPASGGKPTPANVSTGRETQMIKRARPGGGR